jgi:hypothetical protein
MMGDEALTRKAFMDFAGATVRSVAMRNARVDTAKVTEALENF